MDYREILKNQFQRQRDLNPRFSLRSFAARLEIAPSKLSEVLSGKKKLSAARVEVLSRKLNLKGNLKEIFIGSAELESSRAQNKGDLKQRMQKLARAINAEKTEQRNAWYFGAVKCLVENGFNPSDWRKQMNLTELQVENAQRFLKRLGRFYPEREELTFEPASLAKKVSDSWAESENPLHADFALLDAGQAEELKVKIRSLIKKYKTEHKNADARDLHLIHFGIASVVHKTDKGDK